MAFTRLVVMIMVASVSLTACNRGHSRKNKSRPSAARLTPPPPGAQATPGAGPTPVTETPPPPPADESARLPDRQTIVGSGAGGAGSFGRQSVFSTNAPAGVETDSGPVSDLTVRSGTSSGGSTEGGSEAPPAPAAKNNQEGKNESAPSQGSSGSAGTGGVTSAAPEKLKTDATTGIGTASPEPKGPGTAAPGQPAKPEKPAPKPAAEKGTACTVNFFRNDNDWSPGLPFQKAKTPRLTFGREPITWGGANQTAAAKAKDAADKAKEKAAQKDAPKPKPSVKKAELDNVGEDQATEGDDASGGSSVMLAAATKKSQSNRPPSNKAKTSAKPAAKKTAAKGKAVPKKKPAPGKGTEQPEPAAETAEAVQNSPAATGNATKYLEYTDASVDGLLNLAFEKSKTIPEFMVESSKQLAIRIEDVQLYTDMGSGESKMDISMKDEKNAVVEVTLKGHLSGVGKFRMDSELNQVVTPPQTAKYSALVVCDDVLRGCKNVLIRLHQLNSEGKINRVVYIIHRHGPVHVTIANRDSKLDKIVNSAKRDFMGLLINTSQNACLNILDLASSTRKEEERRDFGACMMERKQAQCGKSGSPSSNGLAAEDFVLRTWSVLYGKAGFQWMAAKKKVSSLLDYENRGQSEFTITGALARSSRRPMVPKHLVHFETPNPKLKDQISKVVVVANDGGGNLNLQVDFKGGGPKPFTRVSLTSLFDDHKVQNSALEDVSQMPDIAADRFANKE